MSSVKDNLPVNQGEFYVKYNKDNEPEYGFLVEGTIIKAFYAFNERTPKIIYLPDLSNKVTPKKLEDEDAYANEVVEATLVHNNHNYLRGQVRLAKNCFQGVTDITIVKTTNESLYIDNECFDPKANIAFILPENCELKSVVKTEPFQDKEIYPIIVDKNVLSNIDGHINYPTGVNWSVQKYDQNEYSEKKIANISVDPDYFIKDDQLVVVNAMEQEQRVA